MASPWVERAMARTLPPKSLDNFAPAKGGIVTNQELIAHLAQRGITAHVSTWDGGQTLRWYNFGQHVAITSEWGDESLATLTFRRFPDLAPVEDDPTIQHEGVYVDAS